MSYKKWYKDHEKEILDDFFTLLRFPSVSAQEEHTKDLEACANWLMAYVEKLGFSTVLWEGRGHPTIFAERIVDSKAPTVLIYGHYDVQPPEPLELWDSNPFEPEIRDGKIYARGAEDNKGQNFYTICAVRAFIEMNPTKKLNIKLLIEGEEEMGSTTLEEILPKYEKELQADSLLVVDLGMNSWEAPAVTLGTRGIATFEVCVRSMDIDVHSGAMGGIVYNPIRALSEVIAAAFNEDGSIAIPGFYNDLEPLTESEKSKIDLTFDEKACIKDCGAKVFHSERDFSLRECNVIRPTFEVNGIWGGYTGQGFKTVIPKVAFAKISCRLVRNMDPKKVLDQVVAFFKDQLPDGMEIDFTSHGGGVSCWGSPESKTALAMKHAYDEFFGKSSFCFSGGSVPITTDLQRYSGAEVVMPGTGLDSNNIHAPNENFSLKQFEAGFMIQSRFLEIYAENNSPGNLAP